MSVRSKYWEDDDNFYVPVMASETNHYSGLVYDIETDDHTFLTPILVHNSDVRDFVHASDIAKGLLLAVEKYPDCEPFNIASGEPCTTRQLAETILDVIQSKARLEFDTSKPTALRERRVDISKAKRLLGYVPSVSLKDGIADTINWYRERA